MNLSTLITVSIILAVNLATHSEGVRNLSCYTCAHREEGTMLGGEHQLDESCKWGSKPDDKFLQSCLQEDEDNGKGNIYDFVCTNIRIDGTPVGGDRFVGTLRGCAARIVDTVPGNVNNTIANATVNGFNECKQGRVANVFDGFTDDTGKEYMQGIMEIFDSLTTVKICACDVDGCRGPLEDDNNEGGTSSQSPGDGSGSNVQQVAFFVVVISILFVFLS